jgi:hypothetical protein
MPRWSPWSRSINARWSDCVENCKNWRAEVAGAN